MSIHQQIEDVVRAEEQRCGHAFSGGLGFSYHIKVSYTGGIYRSYGNGVIAEDLTRELEKIPAVKRVEFFID